MQNQHNQGENLDLNQSFSRRANTEDEVEACGCPQFLLRHAPDQHHTWTPQPSAFPAGFQPLEHENAYWPSNHTGYETTQYNNQSLALTNTEPMYKTAGLMEPSTYDDRNSFLDDVSILDPLEWEHFSTTNISNQWTGMHPRPMDNSPALVPNLSNEPWNQSVNSSAPTEISNDIPVDLNHNIDSQRQDTNPLVPIIRQSAIRHHSAHTHPYRCRFCPSVFKRNQDRLRHETMHSHTPIFCHVQGCPKSREGGYSRPDKLTEHMWKKHANLGYRKRPW